jgi:hypothetical protein
MLRIGLFSGRTAFGGQSRLYVVGLNPGGPADEREDRTVAWHTDQVLRHFKDDWSAYRDEAWGNGEPGTWGMQPRILHLLKGLRIDPGHVPASNLIFLRSSQQEDIEDRFVDLAESCWPFHEAVIRRLGVRVVLCFGHLCGEWIRIRLQADERAGEFIEENNRRWRSTAFTSPDGIVVVRATHPSRADWTTPEADPTPLVRQMLKTP